MSSVDWRELVSRAEDPEYLAGTEVAPTLGWGEDFERFLRSLA